MFIVKPINVGEHRNDGDLFTITASRKELKALYDFMRTDDVFHADGRIDMDFVVNALRKEIG